MEALTDGAASRRSSTLLLAGVMETRGMRIAERGKVTPQLAPLRSL